MTMDSEELAARLAEIERPKAGLYEIGEEPLWARLMCREWPHRLLPAALAMPLASLAGRVAWHRPGPRDQALHRAWVMTGSTDAAVLARFARRHLREYRMQDELFWRPWLVPRMRVEGIEGLVPGTPTIIAGLHVGPMADLQTALAQRLARADRHFYIARWQNAEDERFQGGPRGRYVPAKVARLEAAGARFVGRGGTYPIFRELLGRGETCWLAIDTAATGRGRVTTLAGRKVRLATGLVSLALETGATIIPAYAYRDGWRPTAKLLDPIDPAGFSDLDSLHGHLVGIAREAVAERPEQVMPDLTLALQWGGSRTNRIGGVKALVTGATGKVGHAIALALAARGDEVRALVRDPARAAGVLPPGVEAVRGDVTEPESLPAAVEGCELVFNAMGIPEQWRPDDGEFERVNAQGSANVARAAAKAGVRRLVHTSTNDVFHAEQGASFDETTLADYPKGTAYERSKQHAEELVLAERDGIEVVITNPVGVYGPGPSSSVSFDQGMFGPLIAKRLPALPPGGMGLVYTEGVAQGHLLAADKGVDGERYILATPT